MPTGKASEGRGECIHILPCSLLIPHRAAAQQQYVVSSLDPSGRCPVDHVGSALDCPVASMYVCTSMRNDEKLVLAYMVAARERQLTATQEVRLGGTNIKSACG